MGRYIPPQRRSPQKLSTDISSPTNTVDINDPSNTEPRSLEDLDLDAQNRPLGTYTLDEIRSYFGDHLERSPLHDSAATPGELSYIILPHEAFPTWGSQTVFAYKNIHIVPGHGDFKAGLDATATVSSGASSVDSASTDDSATEGSRPESPATSEGGNAEEPAATSKSTTEGTVSREVVETGEQPISSNSGYRPKRILPVFTERSRAYDSKYCTFTGYFCIHSIDFHGPGPELSQVLEKKWPSLLEDSSMLREKNRERRNKGRKKEWAVIKLDRVEDLEPPEIKRVELEPRSSEY